MNKAVIRCAAAALLTAALLLPVACASAPLSIADGKYTFTVIDYPGAALTQAYGNNPRGDVVGTYQLATGRDSTVLPKGVQNATGKEYHGFVLKDGKYTTIDYPGATRQEDRLHDGYGDRPFWQRCRLLRLRERATYQCLRVHAEQRR